MTEKLKIVSLKRTNNIKIRRRVAHSELWAWAEETLQRNRAHSVGIQSDILSESILSLEEFSAALVGEGWFGIICIEQQNSISLEHQLSAQILELEQSLKLPKHIELVSHHRSRQPLDGQAADEKLNSIRHNSKHEDERLRNDEDQAWRNLQLNLPDEWSLITDLSQQDHSHEDPPQEAAYPDDKDSPSLSPQIAKSVQHFIAVLQAISQTSGILLIVARDHLSTLDRTFLDQFISELHHKRAHFPLLLLWFNSDIELDDLVHLKCSNATVQPPVIEHENQGDLKPSVVELLSSSTIQTNSNLKDFSEHLELSFDQAFNETFNAQAKLSPIDDLVQQSIDFSQFKDDPLVVLSSLDSSTFLSSEHSQTKDSLEPASTSHISSSMIQPTDSSDQQHPDQQHPDQQSILIDADEVDVEYTTTELKKISSKPPSELGLIERGDFSQCVKIAQERFGKKAVLLTAAAACGPTSSIGQIVALWRGVVERPLDELYPFNESLWETMSLALSERLLVETSNHRFLNEPSFRFNDPKIALKWCQRWQELLSIRLLRRAHRTLAFWMNQQTINPIARPQVALNIIDHLVEAGEMGQAGVASLNAAKLFMERGDSQRAKKSLQRTVQLLGPEGNWTVWKECFELLLKLNLETGDDLATELISKQFIERAWRMGDIGLTRKLSSILERLYKKTGRYEEAQKLGDWSASQPLIDQTTALFDLPLTMYPKGILDEERVVDHPKRTIKHPTLLIDFPPPEELFNEPEASLLIPLPEIHTLEAPPSFLLEALVTLRDQGYEAFVVGGSVRDRLLNRQVNDWDLATSALPNEVIQCFEKVIETGIEHGTVTAVLEGKQIEITTYRVDGDYRDGRRPEEVIFTRSIEEDLLRRDFTVNAIAWDPINATLTDPYDGCKDLQKGILKAVGDAHARFQEDGLRVLRAIRFATTLDFEIDEETEKGAIAAIDTLKKVAAERIQVELLKTLSNDKAARGLSLIHRFNIAEICFPNQPTLPSDHWHRLCEAMSTCDGHITSRLALIFHAIQDYANLSQVQFAKQAKSTLKALKFPNKQSQAVLNLLSFSSLDPNQPRSDALVRALAVEIGIDHLDQLWAYQEAWWRSETDSPRQIDQLNSWQALSERMTALNVDAAPKSAKDLDITGHDLCEALDLFPSRAIGDLLTDLLRWVWVDPTRNEYDRLIERAKQIALERGLAH